MVIKNLDILLSSIIFGLVISSLINAIKKNNAKLKSISDEVSLIKRLSMLKKYDRIDFELITIDHGFHDQSLYKSNTINEPAIIMDNYILKRVPSNGYEENYYLYEKEEYIHYL